MFLRLGAVRPLVPRIVAMQQQQQQQHPPQVGVAIETCLSESSNWFTKRSIYLFQGSST